MLSALLCFGCVTSGLVVGAENAQQIVSRDSAQPLTVAEALVQVESLRAKRTMDSYQQALDLLSQVVRTDESQQALATAVQGEFDDYLWTGECKVLRPLVTSSRLPSRPCDSE
jgi:hypothetical protein